MLNTILTNLTRAIFVKVKAYVEAKETAINTTISTNMEGIGASLAAIDASKASAEVVSVLAATVNDKADAATVNGNIAGLGNAITDLSQNKASVADLAALTATVDLKASAAAVDALTAVVTGLTLDAPETLNTFAEVAAAISSGATDLGLSGLDSSTVSGLVDTAYSDAMGV